MQKQPESAQRITNTEEKSKKMNRLPSGAKQMYSPGPLSHQQQFQSPQKNEQQNIPHHRQQKYMSPVNQYVQNPDSLKQMTKNGFQQTDQFQLLRSQSPQRFAQTHQILSPTRLASPYRLASPNRQAPPSRLLSTSRLPQPQFQQSGNYTQSQPFFQSQRNTFTSPARERLVQKVPQYSRVILDQVLTENKNITNKKESDQVSALGFMDKLVHKFEDVLSPKKETQNIQPTQSPVKNQQLLGYQMKKDINFAPQRVNHQPKYTPQYQQPVSQPLYSNRQPIRPPYSRIPAQFPPQQAPQFQQMAVQQQIQRQKVQRPQSISHQPRNENQQQKAQQGGILDKIGNQFSRFIDAII